jgi:nucleotide-binding universal stress UspA family protein
MESMELGQIRRLVVALDASPCSQVVLRTAARLAGYLEVRLEGVFVQDMSLVRVAELSVAHEMSIHSTRSRPFTRAALERDQRILVDQMEAWASDLARSNNVRWRFQILSGPVAPQLMAAAGESDLLTLGRFGWPVGAARRPLGSVARTVVEQHRFPLLLLDREIQPYQPILVSVDDPVAWPRLFLAARLAASFASPLVVLLAAEEDGVDSLQGQVEQRLALHNIDIVYRRLKANSLARESMHVRADQGSTLFSGRRGGVEEIPLALFLM